MPGNDLALLIDAARKAGEIASGHFKASPEVWDKPGDAGPVTEADLAVDAMLREELTAKRPDYGWLSEETPDSKDRLERSRSFVVDPIDGTRAFIEGGRTWAHSLAIVEDGEPVAAVVYLPMRDKLYSAARGQGAGLNGETIRTSPTDILPGATVLAAKPSFQDRHWAGAVPPVAPHFRSSLAYRLALVAEGRFDAMLTLRDTWEWDIAAGTLLVAEAAGLSTDRFGQPLTFNGPTAKVHGVLAGGAPVQTALLKALTGAA